MANNSSLQPWLIFEQQGKQGYTLLSPFAADKSSSFYAKNIPELSGKITLASCYGWLIVTDSKDPASIFLLNPFTRATLDLPRLELLSEELISKDSKVQFIMTCVPDDKNIEVGRCIVMVLCNNLILFCRPGFRDSWRMHYAHVRVDGVFEQVDCDVLGVFYGTIHRLVFVIGYCHLYRITFASNLVISVTLVTRLKLNKLYRSYQSPCVTRYLVESCGGLYCVMLFGGHDGDYTDIQDVRVIRFVKFVDKDSGKDFVDAVVVQNLENQALFVGSGGYCSSASYVSAATSSRLQNSGLFLQRNCVYILSNLGAGFIYVYRLQDRTLTRVPLFPNSKVPRLARRRCFWVASFQKNRKIDENKNERDIQKAPEDVQIRHTTQFEDLPSELVFSVATRLARSDYSRLSATCKEYRAWAPPIQSWSDKQFKIEYLEATKSYTVLPWLVFFQGDHTICNAIDPINTDQLYLMTTPWKYPYGSIEVVYSKKNWLLMNGYAGNLFFYNPFTKLIITINGKELPSDNVKGHLRCVGASITPPDLDSEPAGLIVGLHGSGETLRIYSYFYGQQSWHNKGLESDENTSFIPTNNSPVYYKHAYYSHAFYFLDIIGRLARYTIAPDGIRRWKVMSKVALPIVCYSSDLMETHLLECNGDLLSVFACLLGRWVKVFRLDFAKECWVQVDNLENYMVFLSPRSSFAALTLANRPDLGNKLYFSRIRENHGVVCYDLKTRRYSSPSNDNMSRENFFESREVLGCTWIEPNWY